MKEKAIILVGGTRIGKSTLFNLILNKRMIGQKKGKNVSYCLMTD
jgi:GTP-binding protein EngB required for normal cell division